jgi:hypothetical protein
MSPELPPPRPDESTDWVPAVRVLIFFESTYAPPPTRGDGTLGPVDEFLPRWTEWLLRDHVPTSTAKASEVQIQVGAEQADLTGQLAAELEPGVANCDADGCEFAWMMASAAW